MTAPGTERLTTDRESFHMVELVKRTGISRKTIYRYLELSLLEPDGRIAQGMLFSDEHARIIRLIGVLKKIGYSIASIRFDIFPRYSQSELAAMSDFQTDELESKIATRFRLKRKPK
jgi:DNA-binding transcriptional MerR regulator